MTRPLNNPATMQAAEDAYSYKRYTERPRVVVVDWRPLVPVVIAAVSLCGLLYGMREILG